MILNSGDLKSPSTFGLYRCRFSRQARQTNESWQNRVRSVVAIHPLWPFRTSGRSLRGESRRERIHGMEPSPVHDLRATYPAGGAARSGIEGSGNSHTHIIHFISME